MMLCDLTYLSVYSSSQMFDVSACKPSVGCYGDNYGKLCQISSMSLIGNGVLRLFDTYLQLNYVPNPKLVITKRHNKERIKKSM